MYSVANNKKEERRKEFYLQSEGQNLITDEMLSKFKERNPELASLVDKYRPSLRRLKFDFFESWCYWIISQQLSGHVADLLIERFRTLCGKVTPTRVKALTVDEMRSVGISNSKATYLHNIADFYLSGKNISYYDQASSDEIRDTYSKIKGIGPWTINMFLIFNLGRLDVLAINDLVVRKGIQRLYNLSHLPKPKEAMELCKNWGDLATIGTILAWIVMGE